MNGIPPSLLGSFEGLLIEPIGSTALAVTVFAIVMTAPQLVSRGRPFDKLLSPVITGLGSLILGVLLVGATILLSQPSFELSNSYLAGLVTSLVIAGTGLISSEVFSRPIVPWADRGSDIDKTIDEIYEPIGRPQPEPEPEEDPLEWLKRDANPDSLLYVGSDDVDASEVKNLIDDLIRKSVNGLNPKTAEFSACFEALREDVDKGRLKFESECRTNREANNRKHVDIDKLRNRLKTIRQQSNLRNKGRSQEFKSEELAQDLLRDTIQYLSGKRTSADDVGESFEAVVNNLTQQKSVLETLQECNRSVTIPANPGVGSQEEIALLVREEISDANQRLDNDESTLADNISDTFSKILSALDDVDNLRTELEEIKDERDRYSDFADKVAARLDVEWAREQVDLPENASDWEVISEALSENLLGERVVRVAADRVANTNELPRGTIAWEFLETTSGASINDSEQVETTFETVVDTLRQYSIVQNQISSDIDVQTIERQGNSVVEQARATGISGLEQVVDEHVTTQLDSLKTVRDADFVTPYLVYTHFERLEDILSRVADRRSQTVPTFDELEDKKQRIENHFADERVNAGNKLSRHFLELAKTLEAEAREAQAAGETRKANVQADAADRLLNHINQMYEQERLRRYLEVI